jgi:hypothetical protein
MLDRLHDVQFSTYEKGIVESGVKYLKGNFLPTRSFRDLADLNAQARSWVMHEAGVRCHGSTREQPLALFALEAPLLAPLPAVAPDLASWHRVVLHRDCHVQLDGAFYSAPHALVGKTLWARASDTVVALHEDYRHLATHLRACTKGQRVTVLEHLPPNARVFFERDRRWCATQAREIGPHCVELIERLLGDRVAERLRAAQGVLALRRHGRERLEAACQRALAHDSAHYRTVKTILAAGADQLPLAEVSTPPAYARARFTRSAADLFAAVEPTDSTVH